MESPLRSIRDNPNSQRAGAAQRSSRGPWSCGPIPARSRSGRSATQHSGQCRQLASKGGPEVVVRTSELLAEPCEVYGAFGAMPIACKQGRPRGREAGKGAAGRALQGGGVESPQHSIQDNADGLRAGAAQRSSCGPINVLAELDKGPEWTSASQRAKRRQPAARWAAQSRPRRPWTSWGWGGQRSVSPPMTFGWGRTGRRGQRSGHYHAARAEEPPEGGRSFYTNTLPKPRPP